MADIRQKQSTNEGVCHAPHSSKSVRLSDCNAAGKGEKRLREKSVIIVNALPPSLLIYHRRGRAARGKSYGEK